jgi:hypothetical protein
MLSVSTASQRNGLSPTVRDVGGERAVSETAACHLYGILFFLRVMLRNYCRQLQNDSNVFMFWVVRTVRNNNNNNNEIKSGYFVCSAVYWTVSAVSTAWRSLQLRVEGGLQYGGQLRI